MVCRGISKGATVGSSEGTGRILQIGCSSVGKRVGKYDTGMKDLNEGICSLTNVTIASYALTVFRNLHMLEDSLVILTEEEYRFSAPALNGGKTDVRVMHRTWTEEQISQGKYGCYEDVQSMYPYMQYTKPMPCGIPTFKNFDQDDAIDIEFLKTFI